MRSFFIKNRTEGFASMVEVIVTSVIFILAAAGILSSVAMLRPHGEVSSEKVEAAYIAKGLLDDLHEEIDATTWYANTGGLSLGAHPMPSIGAYTITYTVSATSDPDLRHLSVDITWPDP
jgi:Tfp pilus assembly protein PilV